MLSGTEELSTNAFLVKLQTVYGRLYHKVAKDCSILLVPSATSIANVSITQELIEAHILQVTHTPCNFLNLCGQGIEINNREVKTSFGFREHRTCTVIQEESVYDSTVSCSFRVVCIDKPIKGKFTANAWIPPHNAITSNTLKQLIGKWPEIIFALDTNLEHFNLTFVMVPGMEKEAGQRIQAICQETTEYLVKQYQEQGHEGPKKQLILQLVEKYAYNYVYPKIWDHLVTTLEARENKLHCAIEHANVDISDIEKIDHKHCTYLLELIQDMKCPHDKLDGIKDTCDYLQKNSGLHDVNADSMLNFLAAIVAKSNLQNILAHIAHMELYINNLSAESRMQDYSFYFSCFRSALICYLQESPSVKLARCS